MKKSTSFLWRMLVAVAIVLSLVSALSVQATISAPATVSATSAPIGCPKVPASPIPANLATGVSIYTNLSWAKPVNASYYDVYFNASISDLNAAILADNPLVSQAFNITTINLVSALGEPLECCTPYYWAVVAWNASRVNPSACSNTSPTWQFTTGPLVGAATGWTWISPYNTVGTEEGDQAQPYDTNTRNSIMVILDKNCDDFNLVNASNFRVTYTISLNGRIQTVVNETPTAAVYHSWHEEGYQCDGNHRYGLVFLTLSKPMTTNATPTVYYINSSKAVLGSTVADDGIAPIVDLSVSGSPYQGGLITVTATATEPLTKALIVVKEQRRNDSLPTTNYFPPQVEQSDEYGGYCTCPRRGLEDEGYTDLDRMDRNGNIATYNFSMQAVDPQSNFFIEVYAHDNTWCDKYIDDYACKWWRHETWSSSSQSITGTDTIDLHLVEGWNLISFPRTPVDPTLRGVFGDEVVSKIYAYNSGKWYGAIYDSVSGLWKTPTGLNPLSTVDAGAGYWVYCSTAGVDQDFCSRYLKHIFEHFGHNLDTDVAWTDLLVELQPMNQLAAPPSYSLASGWNLIGVPVQGSLDQYQLSINSRHETEVLHAPVTQVNDFLSSLNGHWKAIYWYLPLFTIWSDPRHGPDQSYTFASGYLGATPDTAQDSNWRLAYWMTAFGAISPIPQHRDGGDEWSSDGLNQDIAPVVMPGFGYWVWLDQAGTLVPVQ